MLHCEQQCIVKCVLAIFSEARTRCCKASPPAFQCAFSPLFRESEDFLSWMLQCALRGCREENPEVSCWHCSVSDGCNIICKVELSSQGPSIVRAWLRYETVKAGDAVAALKASLKPMATCKRDGQWSNMDATLLVPGDLVLLAAGSAVPADCIVRPCPALPPFLALWPSFLLNPPPLAHGN